MQRRPLGSSGLELSVLGLGTVKFGRNEGVKYPEAFELPSDEAVVTLLRQARDLGINYLDTAPAYGTSEARLGQLLPEVPGDWIVGTKAGESFRDGASHFDFTPDAMRRSVTDSLTRLGREPLDLVLVHSDGRDLDVLAAGALDALLALREEGLIRACGFSGKSVAGGLAALRDGADAVMVTHHLDYREEQSVIEEARRRSRGVLIKKALNSGHLSKTSVADTTDPAARSIAFGLATPGVTSLVIGTLKPERLASNAAATEVSA